MHISYHILHIHIHIAYYVEEVEEEYHKEEEGSQRCLLIAHDLLFLGCFSSVHRSLLKLRCLPAWCLLRLLLCCLLAACLNCALCCACWISPASGSSPAAATSPAAGRTPAAASILSSGWLAAWLARLPVLPAILRRRRAAVAQELITQRECAARRPRSSIINSNVILCLATSALCPA